MNQNNIKKSPGINFNTFWTRLLTKTVLFLVGFRYAFKFGFEVLYFVICGFVFIFSNLGKRDKNTLSAYSVFNENFEELPGTFKDFVPGLNAPSRDNKRVSKSEKKEKEKELIEMYFAKESKMANTDCFCGSKIKFKKCCLDKKKEILKSLK